MQETVWLVLWSTKTWTEDMIEPEFASFCNHNSLFFFDVVFTSPEDGRLAVLAESSDCLNRSSSFNTSFGSWSCKSKAKCEHLHRTYFTFLLHPSNMLQFDSNIKSNDLQVFFKTAALKNYSKFTEHFFRKHLQWNPF